MLHRVSNRASKFFVNRSCFLIDELLLSAIRWLGDLSYLASAGPRTP